jgi:hypothetical protein
MLARWQIKLVVAPPDLFQARASQFRGPDRLLDALDQLLRLFIDCLQILNYSHPVILPKALERPTLRISPAAH